MFLKGQTRTPSVTRQVLYTMTEMHAKDYVCSVLNLSSTFAPGFMSTEIAVHGVVTV